MNFDVDPFLSIMVQHLKLLNEEPELKFLNGILEFIYLSLEDALIEIHLILKFLATCLGLLPFFAHLFGVLGEHDELWQQALGVDHVLRSNQHLVGLHFCLAFQRLCVVV